MKSIKLQPYVSIDIMPVNGYMYPYLLEHPEVAAFLTKSEIECYSDFVSSLITAYLNTRISHVVDTSLSIFTNLMLLVIV
jgi:type VI protein secretion system component VasA